MRKTPSLFSITAVFGLMLATCAAAFGATATVAKFTKPPVIDGKITPGEWDGALRTAGFQAYRNNTIVARMGYTYFGFTKDRLYFAMQSEVPPDGVLRANHTRRDSDIIWDDCLEIWIDPNRGTRESGKGDMSFYTFMTNGVGAVRDVRYDHTKGAPDQGWDANWDIANSVDTEACVWTMEASVSVEDLGMKPEEVIGRTIGILAARNYKAGWWEQAIWFPGTGSSFDTWSAYPTIRLTENMPTVAIESLGDNFFNGELQLRTTIANPGPARQAKVKLYITSTDMPELSDEKVIELPANGSAKYAYDVGPGRLHTDATHTFDLKVTSPEGDDVYIDYQGKWTKAPENKYPGYGGPNPDAAVQLAYYPSYKFIRLKIDILELGKDLRNVSSGEITITTPDGKQLVSEKLKWEKSPHVREFKLPDLPDGEYTATIKLDGVDEPMVRKFVRKHFPWEGNKLGITDKVLPPFTPVSVKGNSIGVVLRDYKMNGLGLWDSVKSQGRELLAAPVALKMNDGQTLKGKGKVTSKTEQAAVYEGTASAPGITVKTRSTMEYDGCMKVELDLLPGKKPQEIESLWLEIPIRDSEAKLWHVTTSGLRNNPAGATPPGEGDIWDSRQFPDGNWYGNFKPYIWLGGEERGICWFADNDRGWVLNVDEKDPKNSTPCLVLNRKNGVVTIRVNLVQKPTTITEARKIVFGLMASPAKPMAKEWRKAHYGVRPEGHRCVNHMGSEYWGSDEHCSSKYPRNGDLSILDAMMDSRLGKPIDVAAFQKGWQERNMQPDMPVGKTYGEGMLNLLRVSINTARNAGLNDMFTVYWEEFHSTNPLHEEVETFKNEWSGTYGFGSTGGLVPSYQDFACWWGAEFLKRGIGLYFDNAFPKRAYDTLTTNAYVLPNGDIQPSAGMWAHREYLRRVWVMHKTLSHPTLPTHMMIHMTNTHIIPYTVWSDSLLDLEWFYGPEPQQSKYSYPMLRAQTLGRQSGSLPTALAYIDSTKSDEEKAFIERSRFGAIFVHEIRARYWGADGKMLNRAIEFGYGEDDCTIYNYWDDGYPVKTSNEDVKTLLMKRGQELLMLVSTWNGVDEKVKITVDTKALGVSPSTAVNDEKQEEDYQYDPATGSFTIDLEGYGVRLVRIR